MIIPGVAVNDHPDRQHNNTCSLWAHGSSAAGRLLLPHANQIALLWTGRDPGVSWILCILWILLQWDLPVTFTDIQKWWCTWPCQLSTSSSNLGIGYGSNWKRALSFLQSKQNLNKPCFFGNRTIGLLQGLVDCLITPLSLLRLISFYQQIYKVLWYPTWPLLDGSWVNQADCVLQ